MAGRPRKSTPSNDAPIENESIGAEEKETEKVEQESILVDDSDKKEEVEKEIKEENLSEDISKKELVKEKKSSKPKACKGCEYNYGSAMCRSCIEYNKK